MANSYIRVPADSTGKYAQTYQNTISGTAVEATAVVLVNSSGTPLDATAGTAVPMVGNVASAAADSGNPVKVAGKYNATAPTLTDGNRGDLQVDINGNLKTVSQTGDSTKTTYRAAAYISYTGVATDVIEIRGSATKTVKVRSITFNAYNPGSSIYILQLTKRSANNSGGTSSALTSVPVDSANAAVTAAIRAYTVQPAALGTSVGLVAYRAYQVMASSTAGQPQTTTFSFGDNGGQPITLRGTAECLCFGFNGGPTLGAATELTFTIDFTEE